LDKEKNKREGKMQGSKLYVGNLDYYITNNQLEELFAQHGTVKEVKIIEGKGFGFVEMSSPAEAEAAQKALDGAEFKERTLKVDEARPREERPRRDFSSNRGRQRGGYSRY
jgi:RNA recognition motif-containing protein